MPESKARKNVATRRKRERGAAAAAVKAPGSRRWVPPVFITVGLLGVAWLVVYYIAGSMVPLISDLGDWNILIGMGLMASAFVISTLWR
ncbi:cell division protein CrgA [Auraticoccus sp. F435]|uniref:Cell division protein CrgA n=1 Tax=Auraticoccus cholistanensis TaxID=2656650 RepID=A0A6A9UPY2_9ACTN|nr:cell division protein CrgA [Auraticoccus cholistanensis]